MTKMMDPATRRLTALRRFAITSTIVTILGHIVFGFEQSYAAPLVGVGTAYVVQIMLEWARARSEGVRPNFVGGWRQLVNFLLPAHIVGLTGAMFLYPGTRLSPIAFVVTLSIATKYLFQTRIDGVKRHFLNPSNAGILAGLVLFPDIGIMLAYQFESGLGDSLDVLLPVALFIAGGLLNARITRKIPLIAGWLGGFVIQGIVRSLAFNTAFLATVVPASGPVAVLFTFYMVTDPGTTPEKPKSQAIFGASVGLLYGVLVITHVVYALFWALFLVCAARGVLHMIISRRQVAGTASAHLAHSGRPAHAASSRSA